MAFSIPRDFTDPSFTPLFRLLSDWDAYTQEANTHKAGAHNGHRSLRKSFVPKFDFRETETAYELHGDLPGISKEDITIEFPETQAIRIRGHIERNYTSNNNAGAITQNGEASSSHKAKATVEDEKPEGQETAVATKDKNNAVEKQQQAPRERYLLQERYAGEFTRTFNIPTMIDHDNVSASFTDGVLTVTLPKAKKPEPRRIVIH
ncbi:HSP20-like chaperone [Podospora fimiseda]|uniref:HSP20-like chaperone n=1 Tax=Podospora fimiseda TaxID=252190 RepID=A0AAN7BJE3_9PEZI|nr:HSP20-like chaperone [Podospora fimiseda]